MKNPSFNSLVHIEDDRGASAPRARHGIALAGSIAAHALAVLAIVVLAPRVERPHTQWVLAYIVELGGNGGAAPKGMGAERKNPSAAGPNTPARAVPDRQLKPAHKSRAATLASASADERISPAQTLRPTMGTGIAAPRFKSFGDRPSCPEQSYGDCTYSSPRPERPGSGGKGSNPNAGSADGTVGGNGSAGNGSGAADSSARAEYGRSPPPPYPLIARRRAQEGTVTLRVLVASDGTVKRLELVQSSGVDSLDDSAIETVRIRWRFVPARRNGSAIESWVVVPITFTLTDVSNN